MRAERGGEGFLFTRAERWALVRRAVCYGDMSGGGVERMRQNLLNYMAHLHLSLFQRPLTVTSDSDASVPDNLKSLSGVLGEPESSTFYHSYQDQQWSSCNITTVDIKYYIRVRKSYNSNETNRVVERTTRLPVSS